MFLLQEIKGAQDGGSFMTYTGTGRLFGKLSCLNRTAITTASGNSTLVEFQTEMPTYDTEVSLFSAKVSLDDRRMFWNHSQCGN